MISVFYTSFVERFDADTFQQYLLQVPHDLRDRILRFARWEDAQASLIGKILLNISLLRVDSSFSLTDLKLSNYNRPYVSNTIDFSISHSKQCVICAITTRSTLGVDVEEIRQVDWRDFESVFVKEEWQKIKSADHPLELFYDSWTKKEAILKCDGRGMYAPIIEAKILNDDLGVLQGERFRLKRLEVLPNYSVNIAYSGIVEQEICLHKITLNDPTVAKKQLRVNSSC